MSSQDPVSSDPIRRQARAVPMEPPPPKKYILVTCRSLTPDEQVVLSHNFKQILSYHQPLSSGQMDIAQMSFDLLIIDETVTANHLFLEIAKPQADALGIPFIVLKQPMSNSKELAGELDAYVIKAVNALSGDNFIRFLTKTKLTKLQSPIIMFLKKLFRLLFA